MSPAVAAVLASTDALSRDEVRELVDALLGELEQVPANPTLSPEVWEEINRRSADLDAGRTKTIPMEEVMERVFGRRPANG